MSSSSSVHRIIVPSSIREGISPHGVSGLITLRTCDGACIAISVVVPGGSAVTHKDAAVALIECSAFMYPLDDLSLVVLDSLTTGTRFEFVVSSLNGLRKILTGNGETREIELVSTTGLAEATLEADAEKRSTSLWIRGAPQALQGGLSLSCTHLVVTHISSGSVNGGALDDAAAVITTAVQRQGSRQGEWLIDVGTTSTCANDAPLAGEGVSSIPPTVRGVIFQPSNVSPQALTKSLEPMLNESAPSYCPGQTRYIVPANGTYPCVPIVVCSGNDTARKTLHRLLGFPLSSGVLRKSAVGVVDIEECAAGATSLKALFLGAGGGPETATSIADVIPNNGEPSKIKRLVCFDVESKKEGSAINLLALPKPKVVAKGICKVVRCPLDYYHYRVDGFNDDGWGCAYRSLQLILSWFQRMGYINAPMPSLEDIQRILYEVDPDKSSKPKFVGSREWIGSFEVMMVLQHYVVGLDCTIQRMETAKDLDTNPTILRTLQTHFEKGGAPVMIGGSNYAHTIVGIDVNVRTLDVQYLVVDPHYPATAPDSSVILSKGWVGWKEASKFFDAKSWYNMCIPRSYEIDQS